ncbi:hypothetical protein Cassandra_0211 [Pseudomonas phage Cassandra]|nr:hypothetical protein Cassandra_0211 [Pseudomonas phage Cassandra]
MHLTSAIILCLVIFFYIIPKLILLQIILEISKLVL